MESCCCCCTSHKHNRHMYNNQPQLVSTQPQAQPLPSPFDPPAPQYGYVGDIGDYKPENRWSGGYKKLDEERDIEMKPYGDRGDRLSGERYGETGRYGQNEGHGKETLDFEQHHGASFGSASANPYENHANASYYGDSGTRLTTPSVPNNHSFTRPDSRERSARGTPTKVSFADPAPAAAGIVTFESSRNKAVFAGTPTSNDSFRRNAPTNDSYGHATPSNVSYAEPPHYESPQPGFNDNSYNHNNYSQTSPIEDTHFGNSQYPGQQPAHPVPGPVRMPDAPGASSAGQRSPRPQRPVVPIPAGQIPGRSNGYAGYSYTSGYE